MPKTKPDKDNPQFIVRLANIKLAMAIARTLTKVTRKSFVVVTCQSRYDVLFRQESGIPWRMVHAVRLVARGLRDYQKVYAESKREQVRA